MSREIAKWKRKEFCGTPCNNVLEIFGINIWINSFDDFCQLGCKPTPLNPPLLISHSKNLINKPKPEVGHAQLGLKPQRWHSLVTKNNFEILIKQTF